MFTTAFKVSSKRFNLLIQHTSLVQIGHTRYAKPGVHIVATISNGVPNMYRSIEPFEIYKDFVCDIGSITTILSIARSLEIFYQHMKIT